MYLKTVSGMLEAEVRSARKANPDTKTLEPTVTSTRSMIDRNTNLLTCVYEYILC